MPQVDVAGIVPCISKLIADYVKSVENNADSETVTENIKENIFDSLAEIKKSDTKIVPYSSISQIVFVLESSQEGLSDLFEESKGCLELVDDPEYAQEKLTMYKIIENLSLAYTQKQFLYATQQKDINQIRENYDEIRSGLVNEAQTITQDVEEKITEIKDEYNKISRELDEAIDTRMNSIYSGFVSVLGIFVSISFTLFGAATLLNNIFTIANEKGFNTSHTVLGANIILAGFATILIYLLIIGLMQSISTITKLNYDFSIRRVSVVIFVAGAIIIGGVIYKNPDFSQLKNGWVYFIIVFLYLIIGIILYRYGSFIKNKILGLNFNLKINAKAYAVTDEFANTFTNIDVGIRNQSINQTVIQSIWIGNNRQVEDQLSIGYYSIRSKEYKLFSSNTVMGLNLPLNEFYLNEAKRGNLFIYIYTFNRVIKKKIKFIQPNKLQL
ncbi:hypothetical protein [Leuconostoc mesenteroides]|uniref:hypothetical protein n=1 Tax=Leuconostoc mesenteroides TaxID=1245 RepID=UPI00235F818E|nr:hypothetical protein [Leuconostoc mesenteroides]